MKKKIIALICAISMCISSATPAMAEDVSSIPATSFETVYDVNPLYSDTISEEDLDEIAIKYEASAISDEDITYETDINKIIDSIRDKMTNRVENFTLYYTQNSDLEEGFLNKWISQAYAETDSPKQGDYLRWHYAGVKCSYGISTYSDGTREFDINFTVSYHSTAEQETELDTKVAEVLSALQISQKSNDSDKVEAIYDYICDNVTYDDTLTKRSAYEALVNGTSVCQGYANLLYRLLRESGISTRIITGTGNGGAHAWNIIELDDKYYLADSTWDINYKENDNYEYFLRGNNNFVNHTSEAEYLTEEFSALYPVSDEDYTRSITSGSGSACGDWTLNSDGVLYIEGTSIGDFTSQSAPWYAYRDQITSVVLSDNIRSIGENAFKNMINLKTINLEGVRTYGESAFANCRNLEEIHFVPGCYGGGTVSIGNLSFSGCTSLKKISLPSDTTIGQSAFNGCSALREIYILPTYGTVYSFNSESNSFTGVNANVYYPINVEISASVQNGVYGGNFIWMEVPRGVYGSSCEWSYSANDATLTITGEGEMTETYSGNKTPWYYLVNELKHITVDGEITSIPSYVFEYQTNVETIKLPKSVETLACNAFNDCEKLNNLLIPYSVNKFTMQFNRCPLLTDLYYEGTKEEWSSITGVTNANGTSSGTKFNIHYLELQDKVDSTCTDDGHDAYYSFGENSVYTQIYDLDKQIIDNPQIIAAKGHEYNDWIIVTKATCIIDGRKSQECSVCGNVVSETIPATGHKWNIEYTVDKEATCTQEGSKSIHCSNCSETKNSTIISKTEHTYGEWIIDKETSCIEEGSKHKVCSVCSNKVEELIPATGHEWNIEYTVDKEATCTEEGSKSIHCSNCSETKNSTTISKTEHTYGEWIIDKETSCIEEGSKHKVCSVCSNKVEELIPATGHEWNIEYTVDKEATCTEEGSKSIHCSNCSETKDSTTISMTEHTEVIDEAIPATCTENGLSEGIHCSVCNKIIKSQIVVPATDHDWNSEYTVDKEATCTEEGSKSIHCNKCTAIKSSTIIAMINHCYSEWIIVNNASCDETGTRYKKCENCKDVIIESIKALGHTEVIDKAIPATCTETGLTEGSHCSVCNEIITAQNVVPLISHTYGSWIVVDEASCNEKGSKYKKCEVCKDVIIESIPALGHTVVIDQAMAATCTTSGLTEGSHCIVCNEIIKAQSIVSATGHSYDDGIVNPKATDKSAGIKTYTCKNGCGATNKEVIPKISSQKLSYTKTVYNGSAKKPTATVKDAAGNTLIKGADYDVTYAAGRTKVGRYKVVITYKGDYEGSKSIYFTIVPKAPSSASASLSSASQTKSYDDIKFTWKKSTGATGYLVYYKKASASKWSGPVVTFNTSYTKKDLSDGVKYSFKVVPYYKTSSGTTKYYITAQYKTASVYTLKKLSAPTLSKSGDKVKVKWTNINGESGYQISKSTSKTGTNIVSTYSTTSGTYKTVSATKGKTYYYKVRVYKIVSGKKIYAPWSTVKAYKK